MAVQFFLPKHRREISLLPTLLSKVLAQPTADPATGPRECFKVMSSESEVGVSDLGVTLYGASVCASIASH